MVLCLRYSFRFSRDVVGKDVLHVVVFFYECFQVGAVQGRFVAKSPRGTSEDHQFDFACHIGSLLLFFFNDT